jgi:hypothetical protein
VTPYRVHVWPWLRAAGSLFLRDWLAITICQRIFAWRAMTDTELEHELEHVRQWKRYGATFPARYLAASMRARRSGKRWYHDNRFEVDARDAAKRLGQASGTKRGQPPRR